MLHQYREKRQLISAQQVRRLAAKDCVNECFRLPSHEIGEMVVEQIKQEVPTLFSPSKINSMFQNP